MRKRCIRSQTGQAIVELALSLPLLLLLSLGTVELGNMINTYLVLAHLTREGANLTSRGTDPDLALNAVIASGAPTIRPDNETRWNVIWSRIGPSDDPNDPNDCNASGSGPDYFVLERIVRGSAGESSKLGAVCNQVVNLPDIEQIASGKNLFVVEIFYDYQTVTPVRNLAAAFFSGLPLNTTLYELAIF